MSSPTHTIDPDGEVIIILRNASPFAQLYENLSTSTVSNMFPRLCGIVQSSHMVSDVSKPAFEEPGLSPKEIRRKRKKEKKKPVSEEAAVEEPHPADVSAVEGGTAKEYPADAPAMKETAAEENPVDVPAETTAEGDFAKSAIRSCLRIQVSAKHLMLASSVFNKTLAGSWKESTTYLQKGSVEVTAESWDIEALMILLRAIHGQYYLVPRRLTLEMLAKVAVIADYYDCKETLYFMTDTWLANTKENIPTTTSRDLILWLWIAWFYQLPSQFKSITSIAMSQSKNLIDTLGLPIPDNVIETDETTESMNRCREKAISDLIVQLHETRDAFLHASLGCCFECRSIMYGALTLQMQSSNLLSPKPEAPFPNLDYNCLVQWVMAFRSPGWYDSPSRYSSYSQSALHRCSDASFISAFAKLKDSLEGLDLNRLTVGQFEISKVPSKESFHFG
ncbi:hypothetical protein N7492_008443 [Penicillium capsulatum]|uniref:BTB domain-containing protein n=1 Tax=Penicillium capsulatum TaxID=69766 RepID=A0A9W9HT34_9EURO|nr:hypothetical protein N7492_008443 [Penicillium capsulatum]KAJ6105845.1 hypothetical protein N7512_009362 [Penicillium capsulatum]